MRGQIKVYGKTVKIGQVGDVHSTPFYSFLLNAIIYSYFPAVFPATFLVMVWFCPALSGIFPALFLLFA